MTRSMILMMTVLVGSGCGLLGGNGDNNGSNDPFESANNAQQEVSDKVDDKLDCSGVIREETRTLITDAIDKADLGGDELVVDPEEIARFVGAVAVSTDTTSLMVANVAAIASLGHMPRALGGQWDELECDDAITSPCVDQLTLAQVGTATTKVTCDADGAPATVRAAFAGGCSLFVTQNSGVVELHRNSGAYSFEEFSIGSVRQVDGLLSVEFSGEEIDRMSVADGDGLSIATNAGKSCEERLTIRELVAEFAPTFTSIAIDAERLADEKTLSILTPDAPATWSTEKPCSCPEAGSAIEWGWKGFLKGQGDARLRLNYGEPTSENSCASVSVDIMNWPEQCDGEGSAGDCGKGAVEALLGPVFSASCVGR